jgi:hypothetical protein
MYPQGSPKTWNRVGKKLNFIKMKKLIVLTSVLMMVIVSCKPDKPSCNINASTIPGTYKPVAYMYKATSSSPEADYFEVFFPDACERDDVYVINTNGTYELKDIGQVCSPANTDSGPWTLTGNKLDMDGIVSTIESFDCKKLVLSYNNRLVPGDKVTATLIKQ